MGAMIILIVFLLCVFTSVPIGFSIGLSVVAYALATGSVNMGYIASGLFASCDSFPLMAIPFFILSGALMEGGGLSKRLVLFFDSLVGHLTGGLAHSKMLTDMVVGYLHDLCRIVILPGENEMEALALGTLRMLRGEEPVHTYYPVCPLPVR